MPARHAVLLTPSIPARLSRPSCGAEHTFCAKNAPAGRKNPLPAAHYCFKSFSCNTYGSPRKCCKQKTYGLTNPFRCNTYAKGGEGGQLLLARNSEIHKRRRPSRSDGGSCEK